MSVRRNASGRAPRPRRAGGTASICGVRPSGLTIRASGAAIPPPFAIMTLYDPFWPRDRMRWLSMGIDSLIGMSVDASPELVRPGVLASFAFGPCSAPEVSVFRRS